MSVPPIMDVSLPWETGIMGEIFDETPAMSIPVPRLAPIPVSERFREAPKQPSSLGARQGAWSAALEKWYVIFSLGRSAWPTGYDLDVAIDNHDLRSIRNVFGNRSANTVLRRGNSILRYAKWYRNVSFSMCPFPIRHYDVEEYVEHRLLKGRHLLRFQVFWRHCAFVSTLLGCPVSKMQYL